MKNISQVQARIYVIDKLLSGRYFGNHQVLSENLVKGKEKNKKIIFDAVRFLANKGFLLMKRKHYGVHVSIDPKMSKELKEYLYKLETP